MRAGRELAADADHRRGVDLIGVPEHRGVAGLVLHAEAVERGVPLGAVDAGFDHEVMDVAGGAVEVVGARLVDDALEERHAEAVEQTKGLEREVGVRERKVLRLPGDGADADADVLGGLLRPLMEERVELQAVRAGVGEEFNDFDLVRRRGGHRVNGQILLAGLVGGGGKGIRRKRSKRAGAEKITTGDHGGVSFFTEGAV